MTEGCTATGRPSPALARGVLLLAGCLAGGRGTWLLVRQPLETMTDRVAGEGWQGLAGLAFPDALAGAMALVLLGCGGWLLATTALAAVAGMLRAGAPFAHGLAGLADRIDRWSPRLVRRLVAAALGAAVTAGAAPALAVQRGPGDLEGLPLPERVVGVGIVAAPATTARVTAPGATAPGRAAATGRVVVVRSGDSLWARAAGLLPAHATDTQVDRAWRQLYLANRCRIGPDPNLILPGERLAVPDLAMPDRQDRTDRTDRPDRKAAQ